MKKLRIDTIVLEGVDKTGKDTILKYIDIIGKHKYAVYQRGLISNATYSEIYNREFDKDMYHSLPAKYLYRPSCGMLRRVARELRRRVDRLMPTGHTASQRPHIRQLLATLRVSMLYRLSRR